MNVKEAKEILIKEAKRRLKINKPYCIDYLEEKESMEDLIELLEYSGI